MWQNSDMWEQRYQMQINRNKEIKHRLHSGNACCQLHQDILSSHLLSKNTQTTIQRTTIPPLFRMTVKPGNSH